MTSIQQAFVYSWENSILQEIQNCLACNNIKVTMSVLDKLSNRASDIVTEVSNNIPIDAKLTDMHIYNKQCSEKIEDMIVNTPHE